MGSIAEAYRGKKVLIMGLGLHGGGVGAARFFAGIGARVTATDLKGERELLPSIQKLAGLPIQFRLGGHDEQDFLEADLVVKNAVIPDDSSYLVAARKNGAAIDTDIGLFFTYTPAFTIGVSGTKGKSTTASLIAHILGRLGARVFLMWLPGTSVFDHWQELTPDSVAVVELASWELESLRPHKKSPRVAVLTNVFPDHLNWHKTFAKYLDAKAALFAFQRPGDAAVLNLDDQNVMSLRDHIASVKYYFTLAPDVVQDMVATHLLGGDAVVRLPEQGDVFRVSRNTPQLAGEHNTANILAALTGVFAAVGHDDFPGPRVMEEDTVALALSSFVPLEGRLEKVGEVGGISFVNDTTATNPGAAVQAVRTFSSSGKQIVLVAGGQDKDLQYDVFARAIAAHVKFVVLFEGTASEKIARELLGLGFSDLTQHVSSMDAAVMIAAAHAMRGDTVLLSPGAASFNMFPHEFARGSAFAEAVKRVSKRI